MLVFGLVNKRGSAERRQLMCGMKARVVNGEKWKQDGDDDEGNRRNG